MVKVTIERESKKQEIECEYFMGVGVTAKEDSEIPAYHTHSVACGAMDAKNLPSIIASWIVKITKQIFGSDTLAALKAISYTSSILHDLVEDELNQSTKKVIDRITKEL